MMFSSLITAQEVFLLKDSDVKKIQNLPGADKVHDCGFYCGNYPDLTEFDIQTLMNCLRYK